MQNVITRERKKNSENKRKLLFELRTKKIARCIRFAFVNNTVCMWGGDLEPYVFQSSSRDDGLITYHFLAA